MHSGGSSQRAATGSPSPQQTKTVLDSAHSSTHPAVGKNKKRERTDQHSSPGKRENFSKIEDGESSPPKRERIAKLDGISTIVDKDGGLANFSCVDELICLMRQERIDGARKTVDVIYRRCALVAVIIATEKEDCRKYFIQSGGLLILDDWLHDGHKGKAGDGSVEAEKGTEELTLVILRALDKLPIDLEALKACSIGKAVNHLRSHRNQEIQKRARKLVDIWKKRVDLEMKCKGELNGPSNQVIPCCEKEPSSNPVQVYPRKGEQGDEDKCSSASNNIAKPGSSDSTVTSAAIVSCVSHRSSSSPNENTMRLQSNGTAIGLPVKEENTNSVCPFLSNCHSSREGNNKSLANKIGTSICSSDSLRSKDLVDVGLAESQKINLEGNLLVLGRNIIDSNSSVCEKVLNDFSCIESIDDRKKIASLSGSNGNNVCAIDSRADTEVRQSNGDSLEADIDMHASTPFDDNANRNMAIPSKDFVTGTVTGQKGHSAGKQHGDTHANGHASAGNATLVERRAGKFDRIMSGTEVTAKVVHNSPNETCPDLVKNQKSIPEVLPETEDGVSRENTSQKVEAFSRTLSTLSSGVYPDKEDSNLDAAVVSDHMENERHTKDNAIEEDKRAESLAQLYSLHHAEVQGMLEVPEADPQSAYKSHGHLSSNSKSGVCRCTCSEGGGNPFCVHSSLFASFKDSCLKARTLGALESRTSEGGVSEDHGFNSQFQEFPSTHCRCSEASSTEGPIAVKNKYELAATNESRTEKSPGTNQAHCSETLDSDIEKEAESVSHFKRENALEIAQKVAGEGEQELEKHGNPLCGASSDKQADNVGCKSLQDLMGDTCGRALKVGNICVEDASQRSSEACNIDSQGTLREEKEGRNAINSNDCRSEDGDFRFVKSISVAEVPREDNEVSIDINQPSEDLHGMANFSRIRDTDTGLATESKSVGQIKLEQSINRLVTGHLTSQVHDFDLNQSLSIDEASQNSAVSFVSASLASASITSVAALGTVPINCSHAAPIAVVTATKGGFILAASSSHNKSEEGWKGSAATSAFRRASPRRNPEKMQVSLDGTILNNVTDIAKRVRTVLDFDLNIANDGMPDDNKGVSSFNNQNENHPSTPANGIAESSDDLFPAANHKMDKLEFDLNRIDDGEGSGLPSTSDYKDATVNFSSERYLKNTRRSVMLEIDLNDGPSLEEAASTLVQRHPRIQNLNATHASAVGLGNSARAGDFVSWSSTGSSYGGVALPSLSMIRPESSFSVASTYPVLGPRHTSDNPVLGPRHTLGTTISPSSSVIYPTAPAFLGCAAFPFPPNVSYNSVPFPGSLPYTITMQGSGTVPTISSIADAPRAVMPSVRPPFFMNFAESGGSSGLGMWGKSDLGMNASGLSNINSREFGSNVKEESIYHGHSLTFEEQMRILQPTGSSGASLKRKEPECGWEQTRAGFRQAMWH